MPGASRFVFIRSAEQLEDRNDLVERSNGILHIQQVPQDALRPVPVPVLRRASVHLLRAPGWPGHLPRPHLPLCRLLLAGLPHGLALGRLAGLTILHKNLHAPGFAGSGLSPPRGGDRPALLPGGERTAFFRDFLLMPSYAKNGRPPRRPFLFSFGFSCAPIGSL